MHSNTNKATVLFFPPKCTKIIEAKQNLVWPAAKDAKNVQNYFLKEPVQNIVNENKSLEMKTAIFLCPRSPESVVFLATIVKQEILMETKVGFVLKSIKEQRKWT